MKALRGKSKNPIALEIKNILAHGHVHSRHWCRRRAHPSYRIISPSQRATARLSHSQPRRICSVAVVTCVGHIAADPFSCSSVYNHRIFESCLFNCLMFSWGIKEAAYKAMYPIVRPTWKELTYHGLGEGPNGTKPALVYRPTAAAEISKIGRTHISVSHDGEYVFASVTIESSIS